MARIVLGISLFALIAFTSTVLVAQEDAPGTGVLTGDKVRVRKGPSTKDKILLVMRKGSKVSVVGKKDGWYEIEMPREIILWVSKNYVKEVREGGAIVGEITGEKVNVRTGVEATDVPVGQVNKGDKVKIVGSKEGWYKIRPPKGFTAYMSAQFVKVGGEAGVEPIVGPGPKAAGDGGMRQRLNELQKQIRILTEEADKLKNDLEDKEKKERELEKKLTEAEELIKDYEREKQELEDKYDGIWKRIRGTKPAPRYTAEGYVDDFGVLVNPPPATHGLYIAAGAEPDYYLKSADASVDLDKCLRKRVGVVGEIVKEKWGNKEIEIIKVTRIDILED